MIWVVSAHFSGISGLHRPSFEGCCQRCCGNSADPRLCGQGRLDQGGMARVQKVLSRVQTKLAGIDSYPRPSVPLALGAHEAASPDGTSLRQAFAPIPGCRFLHDGAKTHDLSIRWPKIFGFEWASRLRASSEPEPERVSALRLTEPWLCR